MKSLLLTRLHIYNTLIRPKFWAAVLMLLSANYLKLKPVADIVFHYDIPVSFGIFGLIFSSGFFLTVLGISLLFIFSDMPFRNGHQVFLITRSGKRVWCVSQLLYIMIISVFVLAVIFAETFLVLGGRISFEPYSWGKVIMSIYNTEIGMKYQVPFIGNAPYESIIALSPLEAVIYVVFAELIISVAMGTAVFAANLIIGGASGVIAGGVPIAINLFMPYFQSTEFFRLSPLSWIELQAVIKLPFKGYAFVILGTVSALFAVLSLIKCRKKADIL